MAAARGAAASLPGRVVDLQELFGALRRDKAAYNLPQQAKDRVRALEQAPCPDTAEGAGQLYHDVLKFFARLRRDAVFSSLHPVLRRRIDAWLGAAAAAAAADPAPRGDVAETQTWVTAHLAAPLVAGDTCALRYSAAGTCAATVESIDAQLAADGEVRLSILVAPPAERRHPAADVAAAMRLRELGAGACAHLPSALLRGDGGTCADLLRGARGGEEASVTLRLSDVSSHLRPIDEDQLAELHGLPGLDQFLALQEPKALAVGPPRQDGGSRVWSAGGAKWGCTTPAEAEAQAVQRCRQRLGTFGEDGDAAEVDVVWRAYWGPEAPPPPAGAVERRWVLGEWRRRDDLPRCVGVELMAALWEHGGALAQRPAAHPPPPPPPPHRGDHSPSQRPPPPPPPRGGDDAQPPPPDPAIAPAADPTDVALRSAAVPTPFPAGTYVQVCERPRLAPALEGHVGHVRGALRGRVCVEFVLPSRQVVSLSPTALRAVTRAEAVDIVTAMHAHLRARPPPPAEDPPPPPPPAPAAPAAPEPAPRAPAQFNPCAQPFVAASVRPPPAWRREPAGYPAQEPPPQEEEEGEEAAVAGDRGSTPPPAGDGAAAEARQARRDEWQQEWQLRMADQKRKQLERRAAGETYATAAKMLSSVLLPGADCGRRPFGAGRGRPAREAG